MWFLRLLFICFDCYGNSLSFLNVVWREYWKFIFFLPLSLNYFNCMMFQNLGAVFVVICWTKLWNYKSLARVLYRGDAKANNWAITENALILKAQDLFQYHDSNGDERRSSCQAHLKKANLTQKIMLKAKQARGGGTLCLR